MSISSPASRPGISPALLAAAGVREVEPDEARTLVGYAEAGLIIPYRTRNSVAVEAVGKPFFRLRVRSPREGGAKYLSPRGAGCQLYEPPGLRTLLVPDCVLGVVEGEFKALALTEAGFPCVAIGGISSACPRNAAGEPDLLPALAALLAEIRPSKLAFIGDADTALIPDFSREALKLARLAGVAVVLPRIPLAAPGNGADDLREKWAVEFPTRWQEILSAAVPVTPGLQPAALAMRLLRREVGSFAKLDPDALDNAKERLVKFAAAIAGDELAAAEVEQIAVDALHIARIVFRHAVRARAESAKQEAAERLAHEAIAALDLDGPNRLFFDGTHYWRREADGAFGKLCREDARLHLNKAGLSKTGDPSPCDAALHTLQVCNRVDFAGPFCGRPAGLHPENGQRVLATRGPTWVEGKPGECPMITALIGNLFGHAARDALASMQCSLFIAWLKLGRLALRHPAEHRPGQVLALIGPPDCGKSLLQSAVITPALGGRCADPGLFFTGQTPFNADLWSAEHLALGDKSLDVDGAQRTTLRNELKRIVAAAVYPLHGKCRDALTFRPIWRVSLSANDDAESASNLPAIDAGFADKIIYLRAYATPTPFYDAEAPGAREAFAATLRAELPAFLAWVDAFEIPAGLRKARFGVTEWHHPAILDLLGESDPLRQIAEVLERWIDGWPAGEDARELPTGELYKSLDEANDGSLARHKISSSPRHLGHQLARLSNTEAWRELLTSTTRRVGGRERNRPQACWRIQRLPAP